MRLISRILLAWAVALPAMAAEEASTETPEAAIVESLLRAFPNLVIEGVAESPIPGVYEVNSNIAKTLYVSGDGRYFVAGDFYEINGNQVSNPAMERMKKMRVEALSDIPVEDMVIFSPDSGDVKTTITVFTDVDCHYCQLLHQEVAALNGYGIRVNYLAWPRSGLDGVTYRKMESIWCAEDRQTAMTRAKAKKTNPPASCENPIAKEYELGIKLGINGTPAIVLSDGQLIPGYVKAPELARRLGLVSDGGS